MPKHFQVNKSRWLQRLLVDFLGNILRGIGVGTRSPGLLLEQALSPTTELLPSRQDMIFHYKKRIVTVDDIPGQPPCCSSAWGSLWLLPPRNFNSSLRYFSLYTTSSVFFWHCADQPFGETQSKGPSQEQRKETDDKKFLFTLLWISRALFLFLLLCRKGTLPALLFSIRLSQPPSDLKFPNSESFWSFLHIMPSGDALPFLADNLSFVFCCRETII